MTLSPSIRLANLQKLVRLHQQYWTWLAQLSPNVAAWLEREWEPWVADWFLIAWSRVPGNQLLAKISEQSVRLYELRQRPEAQGVPLPDLTGAALVTEETGWTGPAPVQPPVPAPRPTPPDRVQQGVPLDLDVDDLVAELNRLTNERFWDQTGYKRGQKLNPSDPNDAKMVNRWLNIRYQVAQEQAQRSQESIVGQDENPLVDEMINQTWMRFWDETGYKPGEVLDWTDPADRRMINAWLNIRFQVAQETALEGSQSTSNVGCACARTSNVGCACARPANVGCRSANPYYYGGYPSFFIGADEAGGNGNGNGNGALANRNGLLAQVAPVLAPGSGGFTAKIDLDDRQYLNVQICVDGKCYSTAMDMGPAIALIMEQRAREHANMHKTMNGTMGASDLQVAGEHAIVACDCAIESAGDELVGALLDRHRSVVCAGWLDDIGGAISGAASTVYSGVTKTVKALKGPITIAAAAGATAACGGNPACGAAAAAIVPALIDKAVGDEEAAATVEAVKETAAVNPEVATGLQTAQDAVARAIAAYYVKDTAEKAATGDPVAKTEIDLVATAAEEGDPAAKIAAGIIEKAIAAELAKRQATEAPKRALLSPWTLRGLGQR